MKFKRSIKLQQGLEQLNIAPLIDVIFQLLIFFMLSSSFTFQSGIHVKLPKAVTSDTIQEDNLVISITSENVIYVDNNVYTIQELRAKLSRFRGKGRSILIKSDSRASMGRIVDIWDLCRELDIERINIATSRDR